MSDAKSNTSDEQTPIEEQPLVLPEAEESVEDAPASEPAPESESAPEPAPTPEPAPASPPAPEPVAAPSEPVVTAAPEQVTTVLPENLAAPAQAPAAALPPVPPVPSAAGFPAALPSDEAKPRKLSTFLKVSIILLAALTVASISLLFIGDFEGRFERVFSTFALFAIFVLFTAFDTRSGQKTSWYAPVALIANAYILGLLLIVIWVTPYHPFDLMWEIMWKSLLVILVTRLTILACQFLLNSVERQPVAVGRFAFATSVLAVLAGVLYTAPVGIDAFGLHVPDLYWRIATAVLILAALSLSISLLLRWYYSSDERQARRQQQLLNPAPYVAQPVPEQFQGVPEQFQSAPVQPAPVQVQTAVAEPQPVQVEQQTQPEPSRAVQPEQELLPWPTFADGTPYPMGGDGQPDFEAAGKRL